MGRHLVSSINGFVSCRERSVTVPIQLTCPNGHHLTAKESNAGKTGKCPVCKAAVSIPVLHQTVISDSAIMNILGNPDSPASPASEAATLASKKAPSRSGQSSVTMPHTKLCPSCEREIDMGYHICPHCHTYITGLNDF